ncbi:MAG: DUF3819 domain-containing protein [archaeon]|nr:DUF3819 domain-containing protein [archaeon]
MPYFREAPLIRAHLLINQEKSKKGYKSIQPEISKMSEVFGPQFDKSLHKSLFEEINFKEIKTILNNKSGKGQYFIGEFPQFVDREDFINVFSEILMDTKTENTTQEINEGLNKICKLSLENQIKILIAFIFSGNERFQDAKGMLISKCKDLQKEGKYEHFSEGTLQTLLLILIKYQEEDKEISDIIEFLNELEEQAAEEKEEVGDIEKLLENCPEEPIELEKIFYEIGPTLINNSMVPMNSTLLNYDIDEKRLANLILYLVKHQSCTEDKEVKHLNKIFLQSLDVDVSQLFKEEGNDKKMINWDLDNLYKIFKNSIDAMDKNQIMSALDDPKFSIKDKKNFDYFITTLQKFKILSSVSQFFTFILQKWNNESNQIEFLSFLISNCPNEQFSFKNYNGRKIKKTYDPSIVSQMGKYSSQIEAWCCLDLIEVLFSLSKGNNYMKVKELFEWPIQNIPEILVMGLTTIKPDKDTFLYDEIIQETLPTFLNNHNTSAAKIEEVWLNNQKLIIKTLCSMYENTPDLMTLSRILDLTQKMKDSLIILVNCNYYNFSVNLGILAAKRDFLHLEQWLKERINTAGEEFIEAINNYIQINLIDQCKKNNPNKENILDKAQLTMESLAIILERLMSVCNGKNFSEKLKKECKDIYKAIFEIFDELHFQATSREEIEQNANKIFKSMFKGETTVDEVIEKLIADKNSSDSKAAELYACMTHCILDEYRFYHQYPDKELTIAATIFGQIINHKLLEGILESIALKYILEGIKKGTGAMFKFGTVALMQFIDKIQLWPKYLSNLLEIKQLKAEKHIFDMLIKKHNECYNSNNQNANLIQLSLVQGDIRESQGKKENSNTDSDEGTKTEEAKNNLEEAKNISEEDKEKKKEEKSKTSKKEEKTDKNIFKTCPLPFLFEGENLSSTFATPSDDIRDQLGRLFNSTSVSKEYSKSILNDLKKLFSKNPEFYKFFAVFFTTSKIIMKNSTHVFYFDIFKEMDNKELFKELIRYAVYFTRKILDMKNFKMETMDKESMEGEPLNNLGGWLGLITIARDRPIFAMDLDIKELLFKAYEDGRLIIIVPFVAKILEQINLSKVFTTNNPWIQGLIHLLNEIKQKQNLKPVIQSEIEDLFKKIKIESSSLPHSKLLEKYKVCTKSQDFVGPIISEFEINSEQLVFSDVFNKIINMDSMLSRLVDLCSGKMPAPMSSGSQAPPNTPINSTNQSNLKTEITRILTTNIVSMYTDGIQTPAERAIESSLITAKELLIKDFVFENDEHKFRNAASSIIKSLSGFYCNALCKEYMRNSLKNALKNQLKDKIGDDPKIMECFIYTVEEIDQEFYDILLPYVHNYVVTKATEKLLKDESIVKEIENRKRNTLPELRKLEMIEKSKKLPKILRPNPTGLTDREIKIYDGFDKIREPFKKYEKNYKSNQSGLVVVLKLIKEAINQKNPLPQSVAKTYDLCMKNIQNLLEERNYEDKEQSLGIEQALEDNQMQDLERVREMALITFQYCISSAINSKTVLLNAYSEVIKGFEKFYPEIAEEITKDLLNREDILVKFNYELHYSFLKKNVFNNNEYEKYFLKFLDNLSTREIARKLLQNFYKKKVISSKQFKKIPSYKFNSHSESYYTLFVPNSKISCALGSNRPLFLDYKSCNAASPIVYDRVYQNWTTAYDSIMNSLIEDSLNSKEGLIAKGKKVKDLYDQFITTELFKKATGSGIMMITQRCVMPYTDKGRFYVEFEAIFLYNLLYALDQNYDDKIKFFAGILEAVYKTFHADYIKSETEFNQRPYYKLLYNLITDITTIEKTDVILNSPYKKIQFLMVIADMLLLMSPINYPGFALAWLDLISSKNFVYNFLEPSKTKEGRTYDIAKFDKYLYLIGDLFSFLKLNCGNVIWDYNTKIFLDNVYKFMFLLCHSFPDFISGYYFLILQALPSGSNFIQLKNLILSCHPSDIEIPNPLTEEVKDIYSANKLAPILFTKDNLLEPGWKKYIDSFVENKNEQIVDELIKKLNNPKKEKNNRFSIINSIIGYWSQSIVKIIYERKRENSGFFSNDFFLRLIKNLESENRDHFINSILNELRYPSIQTHYFAYILIFICTEVKNDIIEEHIIKNLLERLIFKPHPWGLVLAFVNLMKHKKYEPKMQEIINNNKIQNVIENLLPNCYDKDLNNYMTI